MRCVLRFHTCLLLVVLANHTVPHPYLRLGHPLTFPEQRKTKKWRTPHFMGRYSAFLACLPSFIVKNAHNLQPLKGGCKFVFLFSSFSLLLPFSALFFLFFLCFYESQSLKIAHQLRCAAKKYIRNVHRGLHLSISLGCIRKEPFGP